ncbi:MAG: hypothetical protein GW946_03935 [Candidatus Pacebacteria bacterium]|nr:hypothetical protein [Candidatus Paceibacterota bacterium]
MSLSPTFFNQQYKIIQKIAAIFALLVGLFVVAIFIRYHQKMLPNVFIDGHNIGGKSALEARELLLSRATFPEEHTLTIQADNVVVAKSSTELGLTRLVDQELEKAFAIGRQGSLLHRFAQFVSVVFRPRIFETRLSYQNETLESMIKLLAEKVDQPGQEPGATLRLSGNKHTLDIFPGQFGRKLNQAATKESVLRGLNTGTFGITAVVASTAGELSDQEIAAAQARAEKFVGKKIIISSDEQRITLDDISLIELLAFPDGASQHKTTELLANWESVFYRDAVEPVFEYDQNSLVVSKFVAPLDGTRLLVRETRENLLAALAKIESGDEAEIQQAKLSLQRTAPTKSLAETNSLGINERIGLGTSEYAHSIPNRIHNVALTTNKISLHLIPPGEQFSFNKTLGDVSARTGFRSAYVIKNGQTQLGDGGGVCQVSTTLFRAVLDAGLKVTRRLPHSYRVSYYELDNKPGIDATVYSGETDFRFINDTDHYVLISGEANSDNLTMKIELYGTSDGRTSEIVDHSTWNPRPPLPPEYIPSTALPKGKLQQVDWSAPGISAKFTNIVRDKNGNEIHNDTYTSVYRPWAAKFLQGV